VINRVIIVSPYIVYGLFCRRLCRDLRSLQIEEKTKVIPETGWSELGQHIAAHETYMQKTGIVFGHGRLTIFNAAHKELKKVDKDVC